MVCHQTIATTAWEIRIPEYFGSFKNLRYLNISSSGFVGNIPTHLGNLSSLEHLDLGDAAIIIVPSYNDLATDNLKWLASLSSLKSLDMSWVSIRHSEDCWNSLDSAIFPWLSNLTRLEHLNLGFNSLNSSMLEIFDPLASLKVLDLPGNAFTGTLVPLCFLSEFHFSKLSKLQTLHISSNLFVWNVSSNWVPPFQLSDIAMKSIKIGPHFPHWLRTQRYVERLFMSNASISSVIPDWFEKFFWNSFELDLSKNQISGELPLKPHVEGYKKMWYLSLSNNYLSGGIPKWLCSFEILMILALSTNQLYGEIPPCLGKLQSLGVLDLGNNNLSGHIPNSLGSLQWLYSMHLQNNELEGKLPGTMQNLTSLITLDLSENKLMDCFGNFTAMTFDDKQSYDSYNGTYEDEIDKVIKGLTLQYTRNLRFLKSIDLSGNHIAGKIPVEIMSLHALQNLNFSRNNLSGTIPETIGNLRKIESLDLSRNEFSGPIPPSLSSLNFLSHLNLSFSHLYGRIPTGRQLQTLNDPSIYMGNEGLCGAPLPKDCPNDVPSFVNQSTKINSDDHHEFFMWFYVGMGPGFFVGFIGVLSILLFARSWSYALEEETPFQHVKSNPH
nr:leucine-rich repeat receptor protein kinase EMS1-like [Ipomoea batatas]